MRKLLLETLTVSFTFTMITVMIFPILMIITVMGVQNKNDDLFVFGLRGRVKMKITKSVLFTSGDASTSVTGGFGKVSP